MSDKGHWEDPRDWDLLTNVWTEKPGAYRLTPRGFEPVDPVAVPQADGAGE